MLSAWANRKKKSLASQQLRSSIASWRWRRNVCLAVCGMPGVYIYLRQVLLGSAEKPHRKLGVRGRHFQIQRKVTSRHVVKAAVGGASRYKVEQDLGRAFQFELNLEHIIA